MYEVAFTATTSAGWSEAIEIIDSDTNQPLDTSGFSFRLEVDDRHGCRILSASTDDDAIERPDDHTIRWAITPSQMKVFCPGTTYRVGLIMITDEGVQQLLVGSLSYIDGVVS